MTPRQQRTSNYQSARHEGRADQFVQLLLRKEGRLRLPDPQRSQRIEGQDYLGQGYETTWYATEKANAQEPVANNFQATLV
jgi:hypothetical protein